MVLFIVIHKFTESPQIEHQGLGTTATDLEIKVGEIKSLCNHVYIQSTV